MVGVLNSEHYAAFLGISMWILSSLFFKPFFWLINGIESQNFCRNCHFQKTFGGKNAKYIFVQDLFVCCYLWREKKTIFLDVYGSVSIFFKKIKKKLRCYPRKLGLHKICDAGNLYQSWPEIFRNFIYQCLSFRVAC